MRTLIYSLLLLVIFGSSISFAASATTNFGGLFSQVPGVMAAFGQANAAFIGAGCAIIVCAVVAGIKNAGNAQQMIFAIVNPLILCVLMQISMDGNPWGNIGLCTLAGNMGDDLAQEINPSIYTAGQFDGTKLFQPGGPIKNLGDIWNALTDDADKTKQELMSDPAGKQTATDTPAAKEDQQFKASLGASGSLSGSSILGGLLGLLYLALFGVIEVISIILIAISAVIVNIMLTLRLFLLLLSSVFLPLFIAALSLGSVRSIGQNYIMSVVCLASWPMGWAAGHIGTIALFGMAWQSLTQMIANPYSLSLVLSAGLILLVCPFWIIVVTLSGPSAMCKMVTKGANFASSMATSSMQMAASTAGTALIAGAAIATGGSSLAVTGLPGGIKGGGGGDDCNCDDKASKGEGDSSSSGKAALAAAALGAGGGGGGVDFKGAGEGATSSSVSSAAGEVGADQSSFDFGTTEAEQAEQLDFGFEKMGGDEEEEGADGTDDDQMSFDFGEAQTDTDPDAESSVLIENAEEHTEGADTGEAEVAEGAAAALASTAAVAASGVAKTPEQLAAAAAAKKAKRAKLAGRLRQVGNLLKKASKFDGSPESLVRSGFFDFPEPVPANKELDMLKEIRDELKGTKSSTDAMKDIGVDPSKKALGPLPEDDEPSTATGADEEGAADQESAENDPDSIQTEAGTGNPGGPVVMGKTSGADGSTVTRGSTSDMVTNPAALDKSDDKKKEGPSKLRTMVKGNLKRFGGLLKKASTFDGSPESLVRSGFFDFPDPKPSSSELDVLTDIRDSLKKDPTPSASSSNFAMKESQINPDTKPSPAEEPEDAPEVTTPQASSNQSGDDDGEEKHRLAPTLLKGFGNLLKKASTFDGSGDSLVRSGLFDVPEPDKVAPEVKVLKEIKSQIRNMNPSVRKALEDIKSKDNNPSK